MSQPTISLPDGFQMGSADPKEAFRSAGQVNYEAWRSSERMMAWADMDQVSKEAWERAAQAVLALWCRIPSSQ